MNLLSLLALSAMAPSDIPPVATEVVLPIRNATFDKNGTARERKQGGNPRVLEGQLVFEGSSDGNRQVDPQIAVGGGFVLHGTNSGIVIYDKQGNWVDGVPQSEFNGGIDPKMVFEPNRRVFVFNLWNPWDAEKKKPVNVSVSETSDPRGAWNTYPVPAPEGWDGGAIGTSRKWIGYSFPGGENQTFVMSLDEARRGSPATVYRFKGSLGHPVLTQDAKDDLLFVHLTDSEVVLTTVGERRKGSGPVVKSIVRGPHGFRYFGWPPASPQRGTEAKTASGDRNPKNLVVQSGSVWFSQAVDVDGRAGVAWHEFRLNGTRVQGGVLAHPTNSYIQTSLAVNRRKDVLVGFQETGPEMFISPRYAWRKASDPRGTLREIVRFGEGIAATEGGSWGDYSGSCMDGDNRVDLWTIQSIANAQGRGSTLITRRKM